MACEVNSDDIPRWMVQKHMVDLKCCLKRCEEMCECTSVDYYEATMWCNIFKAPCTHPMKRSARVSSWKMVSGRL